MKRKVQVFIASPSDLAGERNAFRKAIDLLNVGFGDGASVEFEALGWEDTLASTGRRSQSVINEEIDKCDVFILALNRRWGQEAPDAKPYSSYTEEEFYRALERWKKESKPEIFVFFKRVDAISEADPGPQLQKVMEFRRQLEETRQVLYHYFDDEKSFIDEVDRHLRAYVKNELPKSDANKNMIVLPIAALKEVKEAKEIAQQKVLEAEKARDSERASVLKVEAMQLEIAEDCSVLSKEGKIEYARQKFSKLVVETSNLRILYLSFEFFYRTGDLDSAQMVLEKWLSLSGKDTCSAETASAYGNLGILYTTRGDLDRTEEMYKKSLAIEEALGRKEGMAADYGNLGNLYLTRGELDRAEEMYRKALNISEALGRKEGIANNYCRFGILYEIRGYLDRAEEMFRRALNINEALGRKEGMANNYGNLGILYETRGDLDHAEEMYKKSLAIEETLHHKEGMAGIYGNLGNLFLTQSNLDRAEEMFLKSLNINEALGRKKETAINCCNLGILYQIQGDLKRAEEMYLKSHWIFSALKSPKEHVVADLLKKLHNETPEKPQKKVKKKATKKVEKKALKEGAVKRKSGKQMAVVRHKRK